MTDEKRRVLIKVAKIALVAISAVLLVTLAVLAARRIFNGSDIDSNHVVVYKSGGRTYIDIDGMKTDCSGLNPSSFDINEKSGKAFFTCPSSYDDSLFDLYYCEINGLGEATKPKLLDYAIKGEFFVNENGTRVYYLKHSSSSNTMEALVCSIDSRKITCFADNVDTIYVFASHDEVYYIKMHSSVRVLYRYTDEGSTQVCRGVSQVMLCNDCDRPHIIFEAPCAADNMLSELYIGYAGEEPRLISDRVSSVLYDGYRQGGNLYYFKSTDTEVSWTSVISDEYRESDMDIEKPERKNFLEFFGMSPAYNQALERYQDKLVRDEIRTALDASFSDGSLAAPVFTAYAFTGEGSRELAGNINPENVCSASSAGNPKIVYENTQMAENVADISALVSIAQQSNLDDVIAYASDLVRSSVKSNGVSLSVSTGSGPAEHSLAEYDRERTVFFFTDDGKHLFALVKDGVSERVTVYTNELTGDLMSPSQSEIVDTNVTSYVFTESGMTYLKIDAGKNRGDLYSYESGTKEKLFNAAYAFLMRQGNVIVLKNYNGNQPEPLADYYAVIDGEEVLIDKGVVISSFTANNDGRVAYITVGKTLKLFDNGVSVTVDEDVSELILFR